MIPILGSIQAGSLDAISLIEISTSLIPTNPSLTMGRKRKSTETNMGRRSHRIVRKPKGNSKGDRRDVIDVQRSSPERGIRSVCPLVSLIQGRPVCHDIRLTRKLWRSS